VTTERFEPSEIHQQPVSADRLVAGLQARSFTGVSIIGAPGVKQPGRPPVPNARLDVTVAEKINRAALLTALQRIAEA
jgi:hypothetical protein